MLLFLVYPSFIFSPLTKKKTFSEKFIIHLIIGNVYIIILVYILAYLKLFNGLTLGFSLLISGVAIRSFLDRGYFFSTFSQFNDKLQHLFAYEYGFNLFIQNQAKNFFAVINRFWHSLFNENVYEHFTFIILMCYNVYYFSYNSLKFISYGAPDEEVHLYWIQSLIGGDIFPSGVYPHGFHNVVAAISVISGIRATSIISIFGVVTVMLIMMTLFIGLKKVLYFKRFAIIGMFSFSFLNFYSIVAVSRFQYAIPQEYGMIMLIPMILFLFNYLKEQKKFDLVMFGLSFSLSISFHFYITIIAAVICLAIGLTYIYRIFRKKLFLKIIICGFLSTILGLLPLASAVMMGHPLEQSMTWATSVIRGDIYDKDETLELEGSEGIVLEDDYEKLTVMEAIKKDLKNYVFNQLGVFYFIVVLLIFGLLFNIASIIINKDKDNEIAMNQISFILIFAGFIFLMLCRSLGLMTIMETKRVAIFFAYLSGFLFVLPLDLFFRIFKKYNAEYLIVLLMIAFTPTVILALTDYDLLRERPMFYYFQTKGAMYMNNHIMDEYPDFKWTIISPVNDISAVLNNGYHYELVDFILEQENWENDLSIEIPTKYVFIYIEKRPIERYGTLFFEDDISITNRPYVSFDDAETVIDESYEIESIYSNYRNVIMAKAYYWAKQYQKYFPNEMIVYYEDDEIIVYKITQNEYAVNNLAIDYGLNTQIKKED